MRQLSDIEHIDRIAFISALSVLVIAGVAVICINYRTESRKKRYLRVIAQTLWKFTPEVLSKRSEYVWSWWKLFCAGLMLSCLIVSVTVSTWHFTKSVPAAVVFFACWLAFIAVYWALYVEPFFSEGKNAAGVYATSPAAAAAAKAVPASARAAATSFTQHIANTKSNADDSNAAPAGGAATAVAAATESEVTNTDTRLPLTVITGYLGAGKTTLVKHLLHNTEGYKVLVIENEIGDEGVDHDLLLQQTDKENIVLMNNGCICCSVRKDVIDTFHTLFKQIGDLQRQVDWVVIETTGLADPAPLVLSLYMDEACRRALRLDGVLTVVDCINLKHHMQMGAGSKDKDKDKGKGENKSEQGAPKTGGVGGGLASLLSSATAGAVAHGGSTVGEVVKQIAFADRVLLNKVDLLGGPGGSVEQQLDQITAMVKEINPMLAVAGPIKRIIPCSRGELPLSQLLNIQAFDASRCGDALLAEGGGGTGGGAEEGETFCQPINVTRLGQKTGGAVKGGLRMRSTGASSPTATPTAKAATSSSTSSSSSPPVTGVQTLSLVTYDSLDFDALNLWLVDLLQTRGQDIYRMKGILNVFGYDEQFVVQGVHMLFDGCRGRRWDADAVMDTVANGSEDKIGPESELRRSKLVFIGVNLDEYKLRRAFLDCRSALVKRRLEQRRKEQRERRGWFDVLLKGEGGYDDDDDTSDSSGAGNAPAGAAPAAPRPKVKDKNKKSTD